MPAMLVALICGVLFGAGLVVSDMVNPARVLAFLDVAGDWDPSLALVMAAALIPSAIAWRVRRRLPAPLIAERFLVPDSTVIDGRLLGGAALFGVGWGLAGLCPGPAIAALVSGAWQAMIFVLAMLAGMALHRYLVPSPS